MKLPTIAIPSYAGPVPIASGWTGLRGSSSPPLGVGSSAAVLADARRPAEDDPAPITLAWDVAPADGYWSGELEVLASGAAGTLRYLVDAGSGGQLTVVARSLYAAVRATHAAGLGAGERIVSGWVSLGTRPAGSDVVRSVIEPYSTLIPRPRGCDAVRVLRPLAATTGCRLDLRRSSVDSVATVEIPPGYEIGWVPLPAACSHLQIEVTAGLGAPPVLVCRLAL